MLACVDTHYREDASVVACVLFRDWPDAAPAGEIVRAVPPAEGYVPGAFYRRELPALLAVLAEVRVPLEVVVVDGYVWLGSRAGLGAHLYRALEERVAVVGVAKNPFRGATGAVEVMRGASARPLYVTAAGMPKREAAEHVRSMHGDHRLPTLLRRADQLSRTAP